MTPRQRLVRLMGTGEIRERLGFTRQRTQLIVARPDFPAPRYMLGGRRIWLASDVEAWIKKHRPDLAKEPGEEGE
jgi:prophage regulatory protein